MNRLDAQGLSDATDVSYTRRVIDDELDELFSGLPAIELEGPKAVGKTATAVRRAATVYHLDAAARALYRAGRPVEASRGRAACPYR